MPNHSAPDRRRKAMLRIALPLLLLSAPALADEAAEARRYDACIAMAAERPTEAWEEALAWTSMGGGEAARHCGAVALVGLGHYAEAAARLEALAQESRRAEALRAGMLGQAAQAWLLAGQDERALGTLDAALGLAPDDPELRIDRAIARDAAGDLAGARADLDHALSVAPGHPGALALRAATARRAGELAAAEDDVMAALQADPDHPDALLESGILHRLRGDDDQARRDWLRILQAAPASAAADAARRHIEALDVAGAGG